MSKLEMMNMLYDKYKNAFAGEEIVLGSGDLNARIMLIGEAPGRDEVRLSKPFVGIAGKNLEEFLGILGIARKEIYLTNSIKYRLSEVNKKSERTVNRAATRNEIDNNREFLLKEINIIAPEYIITLGNVPLRAITGDYSVNIGAVHGKLSNILINGNVYNLFSLYHPASIIYNIKLKQVYLEDIKILSELIRKV